MQTPIGSSIPDLGSFAADDGSDNVLVLNSAELTVRVAHDGFTIGASRKCDLCLADDTIPALHSVIHMQHGAIWIETADEKAELIVNDRSYRRMALRHNDEMRIGTKNFTIQIGTGAPTAIEQAAAVGEDLTLLTAEELCDRILADQSMVDEFTAGQHAGWEMLLHAIEAASQEADTTELKIDEPRVVARSEASLVSEEAAPADDSSLAEEHAVLDSLLGQIQELNDALTDHTRQLTEREEQVLETTNILNESHQQITQRLGDLIDQMTQTDPPNELRASA